ncbi:MAG: glycosyltransferase family 4 protein [bacterium]|nr:glycosyltransferase family 4 protein [bacterium]
MKKKDKPNRIVFFPKGNYNIPSTRYRCVFYARELKKHGFFTSIMPPRSILKKNICIERYREARKTIGELSQSRKNTIIYAQRTVYQSDFIRFLWVYKKLFNINVVFDFDDSIFLRRKQRTDRMLKISDVVIVGSHFLAEYAQKYNDNVYIVPTAIDTDKFKPARPEKRAKFKIGWVGDGKTYQDDLIMLKKPLISLARTHNIMFKIIGTKDCHKLKEAYKKCEHLKVEMIDWMEPDEIASELTTFDIGVYPLLDNEWNKGKCGLKALEYMSAGIAAVCSDVGENKYFIEDEKDGLLARTSDEWETKLRVLIENNQLKEQIAINGRKTVEEKYSIRVAGEKLAEILKNKFWNNNSMEE